MLAGITLAAVLAGCSLGPIVDRLPTEVGGLPASSPARPVEPYQYPAVHDMPPDRPTTPLSEEEQVRMEKDLQAARDRQEGREATAKKLVSPTKKQPATANDLPPAGAKTNP